MLNAEMYYRYLNAGFRLPATGGSDDFGNSWNGAPPGTSRTYAKVQGPFTFRAWLDAIKAGRTFGTTGPLLFLSVNGHEPSDEIDTKGAAEFQVKMDVASIAPLDKIDIIVNGEVAKSIPVKGRQGRYTLTETVKLDGSGWIAARALGPTDVTVADDYAFAQSSSSQPRTPNSWTTCSPHFGSASNRAASHRPKARRISAKPWNRRTRSINNARSNRLCDLLRELATQLTAPALRGLAETMLGALARKPCLAKVESGR
jgi:hypothetical protein